MRDARMGDLAVENNVSPTLYVVVPCYNEEEVLPETSKRLWQKIRSLIRGGRISTKSRVLFANDGSSDRTWETICELHDNPEYEGVFTGISLSHNRGHQNVLYAGLMAALERGCDVSVSMDADLQDDIDAMDGMLDAYERGANIVYGVRDNRDTDTLFKRGTASAFYSMMRALGTETVPNSADYRLMDVQALEALSRYGEANLFLRGIVPSLGFTTAEVYYRRGERFAGESKYPLKKMVGFAVDGITSFSVTPLRIVTFAGLAFLIISVIMLIYALVSLVIGVAVSGWTSLLVSIWFVGGALMTSLGIVGEYVGKIYIESKHRPRYIVAEELS
ncbi:MAG: glycosyltransferase family 2 protein [Atopobiaceae bacterium]|nr:glycosyltransferase family 2 protein [Atopobiaceae bacterium]